MNAATQKQIDYIVSLQEDSAYLVGVEAPDFRDRRHPAYATARNQALQAMQAEDDPTITYEVVQAMPVAERNARMAALDAREKELLAQFLDIEAERAAKAFAAKQAALTASTDNLTKDEASALIDALKAW